MNCVFIKLIQIYCAFERCIMYLFCWNTSFLWFPLFKIKVAIHVELRLDEKIGVVFHTSIAVILDYKK